MNQFDAERRVFEAILQRPKQGLPAAAPTPSTAAAPTLSTAAAPTPSTAAAPTLSTAAAPTLSPPRVRVHHLKCIEPYFTQVVEQRKVHELRRADRDFQVGDMLQLYEFDPVRGATTGEPVSRLVTYVILGPWPVAAPSQAAQVPCKKCGELPTAFTMHTRPYIMCKRGICLRGSWTPEQWVDMNDIPGLARGWCIMSMRSPTDGELNHFRQQGLL